MRKILLIGFFILSKFNYGQTLSTVVNVKAPEVAAFNKNFETPVSLYTGVPNISIPLYQIQIKGVTIPISLNYHAGGIRVDQEATWVGLGWSLDYGGSISRKVRGVQDEKYYYKAGEDTTLSVAYFNSLPSNNIEDIDFREGLIKDAKYGNRDYMPDEFYYSSLGYSGKFMYNQKNNKFVTFPKDDILINQYSSGINGSYPFYYWNMKFPDGVSVDYGKEAVNSQLDQSALNNIKNEWRIKTIRNTQNDSISYKYELYSYQAHKVTGQSYIIHQSLHPLGQNGIESNTYIPNISYFDCNPDTIDFPEGRVMFITNTRYDFPTQALSRIEVKDLEGNLVRKIQFYYGYFDGDTLEISNDYLGNYPENYRHKRLRLDSIEISGNSEEFARYIFDYYLEGNIPSKFSFSQDHYGYYNEKNNTGLFGLLPSLGVNGGGGDRRVNPTKSKIFSLKSITYPEGGKTEFSYENNTAGIWETPHELLETYQDENFTEKSEGISVSSYSRHTSYPSPDFTDANGARHFIKQFTISENGYSSLGLGWGCYTNFGISTAEENTPYAADNVLFKLEKVEANNDTILVKEWNTTSLNFPSDNSSRIESNQVPLFLTTGNYIMSVRLTYLEPVNSVADNQPYTLNFNINWREFNDTANMVYVGGLRIKEIKYYDAENHPIKRKSYKYINPYANSLNPNFTSGRAISFPKYHQFTFKSLSESTQYIPGYQYSFQLFSNSVLPLETTGGSYVGYEYVDEYTENINDTSEKLRTSYQFSFNQPYFSSYYSYMNLGMWEPKEWTRGKLLAKSYYKGDSIIRKEEYEYFDWSPHLSNPIYEDSVLEINTDLISHQYLKHNMFTIMSDMPEDFLDNPPSFTSINGDWFSQLSSNCKTFHYGAAYHTMHVRMTLGVVNPICDDPVTVPFFVHNTGFDRIKSKTVKSFDDFRNILIKREDYFYDKTPKLHQLTRSKILNSSGDTLVTLFKFPIDSIDAQPYATLLNRHILNTIIENVQFKNNSPIKTLKKQYGTWNNNIIAPLLIQEANGNNSPSAMLRYYGYDNKGNVLSVSKENDVKYSYIYDYNSTYPIAEAVNAPASDIAYTSFEADGKGGWSYSGSANGTYHLTGKKSYLLNGGNISKSGLTSATYIVSYWGKGGNATVNGNGPTRTGKTISEWTYYENEVTTTSITVSGSHYIDELRLYPKGALMKTYTYTPLVGITSECDATNRIVYYEYDGFNRLSFIRDQDHNIVKKICYNYAGQPEDCDTPCTDSTANWQNTSTTPTCEQGTCGNTGYQLQEQRDINPCSQTFNQTQFVQVYNPSVCSSGSSTNVTYNNASNMPGFIATYTNGSTGQVYTFNIPGTGSGVLGCLPVGYYSLGISKPGNNIIMSFSTRCALQSGTSAYFGKVTIGTGLSKCNHVSIDAGY